MRIPTLAVALVLTAPTCALAELSVPSFFGDHMVVQRDGPAMIWGKADPGAMITVSFKANETVTQADANGRWRTTIPTGPADANGSPLTIAARNEAITIVDVVVGEVWFASGQSNMVFTMNRVPAYDKIIAKSEQPLIRMFNAPTMTSVDPQDDSPGQWTLCGPETAPHYSAVAYFFARKLQMELEIPIGVIKSAWGGKPIETFTSRDALGALAATKALVDAALDADAKFDPEQARAAYESRLQQWKAASAAWRQKPAALRGRRPRKPLSPKRPLDTEGQPGVLFNSMIHPFVGYTMRGAIWYQGEGNAKPGAVPYDQTLPLLINDWRSRWQNDFSFYFVQLANFREPSTEPGDSDPWPLLQDRMRRVLATTPKTGMAVTNDIGEANDIHPKNKHDVGERLALWALANDYGRNLVHSGPLYHSSTVKDSVIHIKFDHVGTGLMTRAGAPLRRFEIAGKDQTWHWADASIVGPDTVAVSSQEVTKPVAVRYAWSANPEGANLVNSAGLPASVFRTDEWDDVETQVDHAAQRVLRQRRAWAAEVRSLAAEKAKFRRGSDEYRTTAKKQRELVKQLQALAPKPRP